MSSLEENHIICSICDTKNIEHILGPCKECKKLFCMNCINKHNMTEEYELILQCSNSKCNIQICNKCNKYNKYNYFDEVKNYLVECDDCHDLLCINHSSLSCELFCDKYKCINCSHSNGKNVCYDCIDKSRSLQIKNYKLKKHIYKFHLNIHLIPNMYNIVIEYLQ